MIVVDANVVIATIIENTYSADARAVRMADPDWIVPALWQYEVLNALINECRAGNLSLSGALDAADLAARLLGEQARGCPSSKILEIASTDRLTAYDATYVALARMLGVPLVTEDRQILRACPDVARSMRQFLQPPPVVREKRAAYRAAKRRK